MTKRAERQAWTRIGQLHPFVSCGSCDPNGWVIEGDRTRRCPCWVIHQEKVTRLLADQLRQKVLR
jgi:hypothetical protein